jgi:hypothetical protein
MHALQGLNALRLICNFGMLSEIKSFNLNLAKGDTWGHTEAQNAFDSLLATGESCCVKCATDVGISNDSPIDLLESEMAWVSQCPPKLSQCGRILCGSCGSKLQKDGMHQSWCQHVPPCPALAVSTSKTWTERSSPLNQSVLTYESFPTKIKALVNDIALFSDSKSVVFSAWRLKRCKNCSELTCGLTPTVPLLKPPPRDSPSSHPLSPCLSCFPPRSRFVLQWCLHARHRGYGPFLDLPEWDASLCLLCSQRSPT